MNKRKMKPTYSELDVEVSSATNPLHSGETARPSMAYMESMKRAKASKEHNYIDPRRLTTRQYGIRTKLAAAVFLIGGLVLFITGSVFYWNSKVGDNATGFDMLLTGSIMLVPGSYASLIIVGVSQGWSGYSFQQLPSFD